MKLIIKKCSVGIFIDLSKSFDTLDHTILIDNYNYCYDIRGIPLDWFISCLDNRLQYVKIGDNTSSKVYTTCGVPQGSILGLLLFILYINYIINIFDVAKLIMFDETNIFLCSDSLKGLECLANNELKKLPIGSNKLNKFLLNTKNTNCILFHSKQNQIKINLNKKSTMLKLIK